MDIFTSASTIMPASHFLGILIIAALGTFLFDMFITHDVVYHNHPDLWSYFFKIKFFPSILFMMTFYLFFSAIFNPCVGWFIGIPLGLAADIAFVQSYYAVFPVPGVTRVGLGWEASFKQGYPVHYFDFIAGYVATTLILFLFNVFGYYPVSVKPRIGLRRASWILTFILAIITALYVTIVWVTTPHVLYNTSMGSEDVAYSYSSQPADVQVNMSDQNYTYVANY